MPKAALHIHAAPPRKPLGHAFGGDLESMPWSGRHRPRGSAAWVQSYQNALIESALARRQGDRRDGDEDPFVAFSEAAVEAIQGTKDRLGGDLVEDPVEEESSLERGTEAFRAVIAGWTHGVQPVVNPARREPLNPSERPEDAADRVFVTLILRARMFELLKRLLSEHDRSLAVARLRLIA